MSEVSYQAILGAMPAAPATAYVRLGPGAIATRRRDATKSVRVAVSPDQRRWLEHVAAVTGSGIDADAVVRALIDLGRELDVDWALLSGASSLRQAVRDAVMVRRPTAPVRAG